MEINVITLFPEVIKGPLNQSILKRAQEKKIIKLNLINVRDFALDKHKQVDDIPYGGGPGMVMKVEPLFKAINSVLTPESILILMTPCGKRFTQSYANKLTIEKKLIFICGHYEGIDERIRQIFKPISISIGDYVITNGALAASVVIDAVVRLLPGVLGNIESPKEESFTNGLLEYPQFTRPREFMGYKVPEVLLSGNHNEIRKWRQKQAQLQTGEIK